MPVVHLLDYVAGNIRSLANAIENIGYSIEWIKDPREIETAQVIQRKELVFLQSIKLLLESHSARRRPFWPLSFSIRKWRVPWADSQAH